MKNIKQLITLSCVTLFFGGWVLAQPTFEWVNTMGGTGNDFGRDMVVDNLGNSYTVADFSGVVDFDPGAGVVNLTSLGGVDIAIQKLDANGNLLWVKQIGGTNTANVVSVALDGNGDLLVAGQFKGTVDFDPNVGVTSLTAVGSYLDGYIAKYDSDGNLIWAKQIDGTHHVYAVDMAINSMDEIVLTGRWFQTADFDPGAGVSNMTAVGAGWDAYILKLTSAGNFVWAKQITCTDNMYNQSLAVDLNDNVLVGGYYYATIDVDPGPGTVYYTGSLFYEEMFLVKLDNNGIYVWSKNFTSPTTDQMLSIHVDANNDYYCGGSFSGTLDFDTGAGSAILTTAGSYDAYVLKLNSAGVFQWVNQMGGPANDDLYSITSDSQGDIVVAGLFSGTVDLDPSAGVDNFTSAGTSGAFIQKILLSGAYQWSLASGGTGGVTIRSVAIGPTDEIFSCGSYTTTVDFDPGVGVVNATSAGANDIFVHKLGVCVPGAPIPDVATLPDLLGECSVAAPTAPTASSCGATYSGTPDVSFPITSQGTTLVTWTYDDGMGNTSTQTQNVIVADVTAPSAVCQNITVFLDGAGNASIVAADIDGGSTDNCGALAYSASTTSFTCADLGANNVTLTVTDGSSNSSNCIAVVTVADTTSPTAVCQNITAYLNAAGNATIVAADIDAGSTDNCGIVNLSASQIVFTCANIGANSVTLTATDFSGNSANCSAVVTIVDTTSPTAVCQNITAFLDGAGNVTIVAADVDGGSTDNCGAVTLSASQTAFTCADVGANSVTLTVTDGNGNTASCAAVVTIADTTSPVVSCPGNQLESPNASCMFTLPDYTGLAVSVDNCAGSPVLTQSPVPGSTISGNTTITITANDGNGNTSFCTFDVLLNDVTPPTAVCQNITAYLDGTGNVSIVAADLDGGSTDNCAGLALSASQTAFTCADLGPNNVTLTVTDGNANPSNCIAVVTVMDTISPSASNPIAINVECIGNLPVPDVLVVTDEADNCSGSPVVAFVSEVSDGNTCPETITRTYSVTDVSGNSINVTQMIIVNDVTMPTASNPVAINVECIGDVPAPDVLDVTDEADNCTAVPVVAFVSDVSDGNTCPEVISRTYSVTDDCSNTMTVTQTITVNDVSNPVADVASLTDLTETCEGTPTAPTATDNCDGVLTATPDVTFPITAAGTTVVTWTYTDACGNSSTQTQNVIITPIDNTVTQDDAITISANASGYNYQWVDCSNGNAAIAGATSQTFVATANGSYAVEIDNGTCTVTSSCTVISEVGITENNLLNAVTVYPNPTMDGSFTVQYEGDIKQVEVLDMLGRTIELPADLTTGKVDGSTLATGKYTIRVITNELVFTKQIVVIK